MIATDALSILFIGCFIVGLLYMIVVALLGGHHVGSHGGGHIGHSGAHTVHTAGHAGATGASHSAHTTGQTRGHEMVHHHPSSSHFSVFAVLNPTTIVFFLLGFGFFGFIIHNTTPFALPLLALTSIVCGLVIAALLLILINRFFGDSEGTTIQDVSDRTGVIGKVILTIQANGLGEILYVSPGGMRKSVPARSVDGRRLERDQEVVVVNYQKGVAEVDTWEHFANIEDNDLFPQNETDDLATLRALLEGPDKTDSAYVTKTDLQKE